jgi:hypothetical protein
MFCPSFPFYKLYEEGILKIFYIKNMCHLGLTIKKI